MAQVQKHNDLESYLESVYILSHSYNTVTAYRIGIVKFQKFVQERYGCTDLELVNKIKSEQYNVFDVLQKFVIALDRSYKPQTIKVTLSSVKGYLGHLGLKVYSEDLRRAVKIPKKIITREEAITKEMLVRVLHNSPPKLQTAILVAISTGMRIGEIAQIKVSDIDFNSKPTKIHIRAEITKTKEARDTYLTYEATTSLKDYLKRYFGWMESGGNEAIRKQIIFGRTSMVSKARETKSDRKSPVHMTAVNCLDHSLKRIIKKIPDLDRKNENLRSLIHFHSFRKFFRTTVGEAVSRDFAEALMGHHFYLDTYYTLSEDKKEEMYLKAEPALTVSDFTKIEKTLKGVSEKQRELEERMAKVEKNDVLVPDFLLMNKR